MAGLCDYHCYVALLPFVLVPFEIWTWFNHLNTGGLKFQYSDESGIRVSGIQMVTAECPINGLSLFIWENSLRLLENRIEN